MNISAGSFSLAKIKTSVAQYDVHSDIPDNQIQCMDVSDHALTAAAKPAPQPFSMHGVLSTAVLVGRRTSFMVNIVVLVHATAVRRLLLPCSRHVDPGCGARCCSQRCH